MATHFRAVVDPLIHIAMIILWNGVYLHLGDSHWAAGNQAQQQNNVFLHGTILWHKINGGHLGKQMDYCIAKTLFHIALHI